jgi:hypothetical protein
MDRGKLDKIAEENFKLTAHQISAITEPDFMRAPRGEIDLRLLSIRVASYDSRQHDLSLNGFVHERRDRLACLNDIR